MDKLVEEGVLSKIGKESYAINKDKNLEYEFTIVKEEIDGQLPKVFDRALQLEDRLYMKALYHALPMTHVSMGKLQILLEGEVNQTAARKIIDKMVRDGFVEPKGNKRLGNNHDVSTCGVLHSIGSDLTRMKVTSETNYTDSGNGQNPTKAKEPGNTPISRPVISRESFAVGKENDRTNGIANQGDEGDTIICSKSSQEKRSRKTSAVKEPIHQNIKRQKSEVL
ncbi:hypothetical protein PHAVU_001G261701 [Phaseolus vulgaris]